MGDVISLSDRRAETGEFCVAITVHSDGNVTLDMDTAQLQTREQVNWALSQIALGIHDLVEHKNTLSF